MSIKNTMALCQRTIFYSLRVSFTMVFYAKKIERTF